MSSVSCCVFNMFQMFFCCCCYGWFLCSFGFPLCFQHVSDFFLLLLLRVKFLCWFVVLSTYCFRLCCRFSYGWIPCDWGIYSTVLPNHQFWKRWGLRRRLCVCPNMFQILFCCFSYGWICCVRGSLPVVLSTCCGFFSVVIANGWMYIVFGVI
jgi:hypothetical protein